MAICETEMDPDLECPRVWLMPAREPMRECCRLCRLSVNEVCSCGKCALLSFAASLTIEPTRSEARRGSDTEVMTDASWKDWSEEDEARDILAGAASVLPVADAVDCRFALSICACFARYDLS